MVCDEMNIKNYIATLKFSGIVSWMADKSHNKIMRVAKSKNACPLLVLVLFCDDHPFDNFKISRLVYPSKNHMKEKIKPQFVPCLFHSKNHMNAKHIISGQYETTTFSMML